MARNRSLAAGFGLSCLVLLFMVNFNFVAAPLPEGYTQDAKGIEQEYQPFLNAFNAGTAQPEQKLTALSLPDPNAWFSQYFDPSQVAGLVNDYAALTAAHQRSYLTIMKSFWPSGTHFEVHCESHPITPPSFPPRENAYQPNKPVPIVQFDVTLVADRVGTLGGNTASSLINVVWLDGAYRFLGKGAYPFWSMPKHISRKPPD